jgi:AAA15 family ATPase/GTPase
MEAVTMLIEFRVENHRSIRDEQVLGMEAGRIDGADDRTPRLVDGCSEKILPVVALYGGNASGKSNVLSALAFMKEAVIHSHRSWSPDGGIPRDPFAWGQKRIEPSTFEVAIAVAGVRYQYGFRLNDKVFLEEWLFAWPNNRKQAWLKRDGETFKFSDNLKGENKVIEEVTRSNALFLSAAAQLKHKQLTPIFSWFSVIQTLNVNVPSRRFSFGRARTESIIALMMDDEREERQTLLFEDDESSATQLGRFKALIRSADVGIVDMRFIRKEEPPPGVTYRHSGLELKHQSESEDAWLPLEEESQGTRTLFRIALPILGALNHGRIMVVDELEASMHPNLAENIVRQFNDPATNRRNAQLIFSTHDTNLLGTLVGEPALRRDQVWLTEKDRAGATILYPLTDFKPRKHENIERGYVQGRYGAIPYLGNFRISEE